MKGSRQRNCRGKVNDMTKIYKYFCMLFVGSILPFLIAETYLQEYVTVGYLVLLTSVVFVCCVFIESLKGKIVRVLEARCNDLQDVPWVKEEPEKASVYYFRNYW
jgi:hypothetical protein